MRYVILLLLYATNTWADCASLETASKLLDSDTFIKTNQKLRAQKIEPTVKLADVSQARNYAYKFPAFEEFGFGLPSKNSLQGWKPYRSRMSKSAFNEKIIGWEKKLPNGSSARIRLDWEPIAGSNKGIAHYNIEFFKINKNGKNENFKLKVEYKCHNGPCSEQEILSQVNRMN